MRDEEILAQIPAARERARVAAQTEPRAEGAKYDSQTGRIVVELTSGWSFSFPPGVASRLSGASPSELAAVEVYPGGGALRWESLDEDISVPGILRHVLETPTAQSIGRKGGSRTSSAKARAARVNGQKGGRPRKKRIMP